MSKLSVLVAVYNTESYLRQCLDSLVHQTFRDLQIICVDDASTDGSLALLKAFQETDSRIEVVALHENGGAAHARNVALKRAKGDYICFVDSDDWLDSRALQQVVDTFAHHPLTDSVLFTCVMVREGHQKIYPVPGREKWTGKEAFVASLTWQIHGVYAVRAEIHHRYPYDESCRAYSDDNTTRLHYLASREVRSCGARYYYRQHPESVTHAVGIRRFDYLKANRSMKETLIRLRVSSDIIDLYENVMWLNVVGLYGFYREHRQTLERQGVARECLTEIRHSWAEIETPRLTFKNRWKFGYLPFHPFWNFFRLEETCYFGMKRLLKKL